ncbi:hypothetical protein A7U60_g3398 [Sanghuangporus baumii]|uniref:Novel STAND NTPase 1 domain-containing protein n=1 Tax=Sanghuangporus baumii TaxID=108892 RepID=A0A9Q5I196_SANBA|nr:hypothetical protein A7U60_g3398 [Sanghuangporus baumii]
MSNRDGQAQRKDTQKTLVESLTETTGKKQWLKSGFQQRLIPFFTVNPPKVDRKNITRRSSTGKACVEEYEPMFSDSETFVISPISATSTHFSPITPESARLSRSSSIVISSPENQKHERTFSCFFDKHNGDLFDSGRATLLLASRAALRLGEASNIPYLKGAASIILLIVEYVEGTSSNREECSRIIRRVSQLCQAVERKTIKVGCVTPGELEDEAVRLGKTFMNVQQEMEQLSNCKGHYLRRVLQMDKDREIIKRCDAELEDALKLFAVESFIDIRTWLAGFEQRMAQILERTAVTSEVLEHNGHRVQRDIKVSERPALSSALGTSDKYESRPVALPSPPEIFFGREDDLKQLVRATLSPKAARIAVLGPGGVGKTSLTHKLLHHKDVKKRYEDNRFFVPCDSATSVDGLISAIELHLGLNEQKGRNTGVSSPREDGILTFLAEVGGGSDQTSDQASVRPVIVVLDNFESPWEPDRAKVERLLLRLTTAENLNLTLVVTLRGTERPSGIAWDEPFLPPIRTLDPASAREMFLKISGALNDPICNTEAPDELDELVALCGYLPLAIRLMAELTSVEGGDVNIVLERWKSVVSSISLLSSGEDPTHSLEVSIQLSLDSPRMKRDPDAGILLTVLALLPDGLREEDLDRVVPQLENRQKGRLTLIKTALAYKESGRLKVLAPIRTYITGSKKYKLQPRFIKPLENHFWGFLSIARYDQRDTESFKRVFLELGNIECLINRAFDDTFDPSAAVSAAISLAQFFLQTALVMPRLAQLQRALQLSESMGYDRLKADCIYAMALAKRLYPKLHKEAATCEEEFRKASELYQRANDKVGQGNCLYQLGAFNYSARHFEEAKAYCEKALQLHSEAECFKGEATSLYYLARILHTMNETNLAVTHAEKALRLLRTKRNDRVLEAQCLQYLGYMQFATLCNYKEARMLLEESSRIYKELSLEESPNCMDVMVSLGELEFICSRHDNARDAFELAANVYRKTKKPDREAHARVFLGLACLSLQLPQEAAKHIRDGLAIWEEVRNKWGIGTGFVALGDLSMYERSFTEAEARYLKALDCFTRDSNHWKAFEAECRMKMGILRIRMEQENEARECFQRASRLYDEAACRRGKANCSRYLAELDLKSPDSQVQRGALERLEGVQREYSDMSLLIECQQCDFHIAATYKSLGEKPPKPRQLQINA